MLHFCPCEPEGHDVSVIPSIVHFCEHTIPSMSKLFVHTWLAHSVDVSLTTVHAEPNPAPLPLDASIEGGASALQAANRMHARRLFIASIIT
jgi:hypothetical protein